MISAKAAARAEYGVLYLVSTPIGNLGDMSHRAVEVLSSAALDRCGGHAPLASLLDHYKIATPLSSYHEHNEAKERRRGLSRACCRGFDRLISDAGTPLLSDPGSRLVAAALEAGAPVVPIPGASSIMAALVASGLPLERFTFFGFLPRKGRERTEIISEIVDSRATVVLFEAPTRVAATLEALIEAGAGERQVVVARELTKKFEEFRRGSITELASVYAKADPKGEVVLVIGGAEARTVSESDLNDAARRLRAAGKAPRDIMDYLVSSLGASRNAAYRVAHEHDS